MYDRISQFLQILQRQIHILKRPATSSNEEIILASENFSKWSSFSNDICWWADHFLVDFIKHNWSTFTLCKYDQLHFMWGRYSKRQGFILIAEGLAKETLDRVHWEAQTARGEKRNKTKTASSVNVMSAACFLLKCWLLLITN